MSSVAPQSQNGFDMPAAQGPGGAAASPSSTDEQARAAPRFRAGSRILYDNDGVPVKGTVAKPNATGEPLCSHMTCTLHCMPLRSYTSAC